MLMMIFCVAITLSKGLVWYSGYKIICSWLHSCFIYCEIVMSNNDMLYSVLLFSPWYWGGGEGDCKFDLWNLLLDQHLSFVMGRILFRIAIGLDLEFLYVGMSMLNMLVSIVLSWRYLVSMVKDFYQVAWCLLPINERG